MLSGSRSRRACEIWGAIASSFQLHYRYIAHRGRRWISMGYRAHLQRPSLDGYLQQIEDALRGAAMRHISIAAQGSVSLIASCRTKSEITPDVISITPIRRCTVMSRIYTRDVFLYLVTRRLRYRAPQAMHCASASNAHAPSRYI